jgi:hypothetical protein
MSLLDAFPLHAGEAHFHGFRWVACLGLRAVVLYIVLVSLSVFVTCCVSWLVIQRLACAWMQLVRL